MSQLGEYFKQERERRGLSLHEIGLSLKINPKILAALEEGQKDNLPAKTFLRGFIRSYAQYLRLDPVKALSFFEAEYGGPRPEAPHGPAISTPKPIVAPSSGEASPTAPSSNPESLRGRKMDDSKAKQGRLLLILAGVLMFGGVIFIAKMVDKYEKERTTRPLHIDTGFATPTPTPSTEPENKVGGEAIISPLTSSGNQPEISSRALATPSVTPQGPAPTSTPIPAAAAKVTGPAIVAATPIPTPKPTATPSPTPSPTPTPTPTPKPSPTPKASPTPAATAAAAATTKSENQDGTAPSTTPTPAPRVNEVILETLAPVTVVYTASGGKTQTFSWVPPQLHAFRSKGIIKLEISDGSAVNLIVNGRDRGSPGEAGKAVNLSLP